MRHLLATLTVLLALPAARAADPRVGLRPAYGSVPATFVDSITPPAAERGTTTRVTFTGHGFGPALDVWASLPAGGLKAVPVESRPDRVVFDVTVALDAPVGVCGLRVATAHGLSNLHLFLIDDLPVRPGAADSPLSLPAAAWGTLREGSRDRYRIAVGAGERVSFEAVANRFGKDADALVTIRDAAGAFAAEHDNSPGLGFDCRFEHRFAAAGTYTVDVRDARFRGGDTHHYVLRVGRFPAGRVAVPAAVEAGFVGPVSLPEVPDAAFAIAAPRRVPLGPFDAVLKRPGDHGSTWVPVTTAAGPVTVAEPFDAGRDSGLSQLASPPAAFAYQLGPGRLNPFLAIDRTLSHGRAQATPAVVPGTLCGVLRTPGRADTFRVRLAKGERLFLRGEAQSLNSPAELELAVTDRIGRELARGAEQNDEVNLSFTAPATGDYGVVVRDALRDGGDAFAYRVTARRDPFPPTLTAEVEGLTVPQGSYQPVPVVRTGTGSAVKLRLVGAPPGLRLTPDEIPTGAASVVCKLEADAAPLGVHTVQLAAEVAGEWVSVRTRPLIDRKLENVDLISLALREDQRRLPAAVADRLAVQVTPPAPFTFELPESVVVLPRYQKAPIPLATTRAAGFDGPLTVTAAGGQLADKNEGRTRLYAEFPDATAGVVAAKILSNLGKTRVAVTATGTHAGRRIALTRTFDLEVTTAFRVAAEPAQVKLLPGESGRMKLLVSRAKSFDGPVTLRLTPMADVTFPEVVIVAKGATAAEIDIAVSPAAAARQQNLTVTATADVDGFEEEVRAAVPVEVRAAAPKKN
ncbi:hypothetical protein [Urbifossiella limnaea]|uniref:Peptidase C-terminal archaeal/bacterial domain-containing protein n=1 Tax=Urbifossiella limnaea TaxID=2528023 RepID=A0A517XXB9_9BACT|nr:hypothetical protein [Urbifossiella limnaea]QDU22159.1 hypothetical protein ETAA1_41350 [Urbifossiella limnaea]